MGRGGWRAPVWSPCVNTLLAALGAQAQVLAGLSGGRRGPATRPAPGREPALPLGALPPTVPGLHTGRPLRFYSCSFSFSEIGRI